MKVRKRERFGFLVALALGFCVAGPNVASASVQKSPMEVIKSATERALKVLQECGGSSLEDIKARRQASRAIAEEYVDFEEAGRRSLGRHWRSLSPDQRTEFIRLFKDLLYFTYIGKVDSYTCGEGDQIRYDEERVEGRFALVKTRVRYQNQDVPVEYRMIQKDDRWMVYDVVIEGVSYVNNYRSQFDNILVNRSVNDFLDSLRQKVAELEKNDRLGR